MKALLTICMLVYASLTFAADAPVQPAANTVVKGKVLEVIDVEGYTYLMLKTSEGQVWAAVNATPLKKGANVTIENVMTMHDFESKSLKKTFPVILFGTLNNGAGHYEAAHSGAPASVDLSDVHVSKAKGANAYTVAEIVGKAARLKDKTVVLHGKVVKYNPGIMGKNWIHLRDGSGAETDNSNDILVTSANPTKLGDIITIKGVVHTNQDFGAGYSYKVLIEDAVVQ